MVAEMSSFPCLVRFVSGSGQVRYRLGERLVDRYLEFVAGRRRPNTLRAVAFDLKAFFAVITKDPVQVTAVDVFDFLAHQRGDRTVIRLADRESGLSARTISRSWPTDAYRSSSSVSAVALHTSAGLAVHSY
jgi:integrase/recombinase XerD